jgi:hypothetical protein
VNSQKLLPCPFCGAIALLQTCGINNFKVICSEDCVIMPPSPNTFFTSKDQAVNEWNRRAPTFDQLELERLRVEVSLITQDLDSKSRELKILREAVNARHN